MKTKKQTKSKGIGSDIWQMLYFQDDAANTFGARTSVFTLAQSPKLIPTARQA